MKLNRFWIFVLIIMSEVETAVHTAKAKKSKLFDDLEEKYTSSRRDICIESNIHLPTQSYIKDNSFDGQLSLLIGHGLGSKNPKSKDMYSDEWTPIVAEAALSSDIVNGAHFYTARGHGNTIGWEETAESDPEQFTWRRLSHDMMALSEALQLQKVVVAGSSMGSATAFYAALHQATSQTENNIIGLIMIRPPTAWESRLARRGNLLSSAKKCKERNGPNDRYHHVLVGTAYSDFPPLDPEQLASSYHLVKCPVLILGVRGDDAHPESTAIKLNELLQNSELHFVDDIHEAEQRWPHLIQSFLHKLVSTC